MIIINYGQERDLICTEQEREIYNIICALSGDDRIQLIRKTDNYVSVVLASSQGYGDMDIARFKFTTRARWILFPYQSNQKIKLSAPGDIESYSDEVIKAVQTARQING